MTQEETYERALVAKIFYRRGAKKIAQSFVDAKTLGVVTDWFASPGCKNIWDAAEELFAEPNFEGMSLFDVLKRANAVGKRSKDKSRQEVEVNKDYLDHSEKGVEDTDDLASYCKLVKNNYFARRFKDIFEKSSLEFASADDSMSVVSSHIALLQDMMKGSNTSGKISISDMVDEVIGQYKNAYHHVQELGEDDYTPGLPLPWKKLAYSMNGFNSVLTILAARPGVGKTSLAVEMMRFWMDNGVKVVLNSLDMSAPELIKRQLAEHSQISSRKLQFGKSSKESWEKYDLPGLEEAGRRLKQLEQEGLYTLYAEHDVDILKANVKILKDQGLIDVLVVDYIQLMGYRGADKVSNQQRVSRISNMLHAITVELGIPVLALSQINRDSSKEGLAPELHDIKDSGAIEQDATNVIMLHPNKPLKTKWLTEPPAQFVNDPSDVAAAKPLMPMWVILAKARDGDAGTKIPFLVVQNKYSWYQADYEAGDSDDMWNRVWDNWKHDSIEQLWDRNGSLIRDENMRAIERFNAATQAKLEAKQAEEERRKPKMEPLRVADPNRPGHFVDATQLKQAELQQVEDVFAEQEPFEEDDQYPF